MGNHNP